MVHPPFAWQLASFPSLPVCGEEAPYCPLRDFATLRAYSPEIKAQQAIFAFLPVYPELVALIGGSVPDYRGIFLRGHGSQVSTHYGTVTHSSAGLGQFQGDATRNLTGTIESVLNRGGYHSGGGVYSGLISRIDYISTREIGGGVGSEFIGRVHFDSSRVVPVAQEIRPVNRSVRYLIRGR